MQWINILQVNEKNESNEKNEVREKKHFFLPLMCQHCGNAPCEPVCPVFAASHSPEGVAETTYNRCIGSRFCMMNCPFKIRRFNFYNYNENLKQPYSHIFNPEVTVRSRGVVEKCSFCIHRLNQARYKAKDMGLEKVPDGMVKTACQQACPSGAIMFGDLNDENSEINKYINDEHLLGVQLFRKLELDNSIIYVTEWSLPVL
jgi:molybdopterin-containing oxidoreductase family iron-sulfur binding subunit